MKKEDLRMIDDMMGALEQTDIWMKMINDDPRIDEGYNNLHLVIDGLPEDEQESIIDAVAELVYAHITPAILYGIRFSNALQAACEAPSLLGKDTLERAVEDNQKAVEERST